jgi:hypothetical protein
MGRIINALLEILNESLIKSILWLMISHWLFILVVFGVFVFELRALHLLGHFSMAWATSPMCFALVILEIASCFLSRLAWISYSYFKLCAVAGMTEVCHHAQLFFFIEMGSC